MRPLSLAGFLWVALHGYRHQRWEIFDNISKHKTDLFVLTGALPRDPSALAGSKN